MSPEAAVQEQEPQSKVEPEGQQALPQTPAAGETQQLQRASAAASIGFGMSANNWDEGFRIANQLAKSELVPKAYQGKAQDIVVAMQLGAELGLPPMQALNSIAVINGRPGVFGDGFLAVIMSSPAYARHSEYYLVGGERRDFLTAEDLKQLDTAAVSSFWRKGNPDPFTATFSIADATRAQLLGKQGPWTQYPARMMKFRARGFAGRDAFAGELRGMKTSEELNDTPIDITVETILNQPPAEPVRRSEKNTVAAAAHDPQGLTPAQAAVTPGVTPPLKDAPPPAVAEAETPKPAGAGKTTAAAAKPEELKQVGPGMVVKNVRITDTKVVEDKNRGDLHYEIVGDNGKVGAAQTWVTKSEELYRAAASCEGSDSRFTVTCHTAKSKDGKREQLVITALQGN